MLQWTLIQLMELLLANIKIYVTGFWKTDQIVTLGLFHFIGPANGPMATLVHYTYTV